VEAIHQLFFGRDSVCEEVESVFGDIALLPERIRRLISKLKHRDLLDDFEKVFPIEEMSSTDDALTLRHPAAPMWNHMMLTEGYYVLLLGDGDKSRGIRGLNCDELADLFEILFTHPMWDIREELATCLTSLTDEPDADDRVGRCLEELTCRQDQLPDRQKNWRITYAVNEAAFQIRAHDDGKLFQKFVKNFYNHGNCRVRGNLQENLIAWMDEQIEPQTLQRIWDANSGTFAYWLEHEDSCWSLDHLHDFFSTSREGVAQDALLAECNSKYLNGPEFDGKKWYKLDRLTFVKTIERVRKRIVKEWSETVEGSHG
jgi:hypothetical protein